MHYKTFQRHLEKTLEPAATRAAEAVITQCRNEVTKLYKDLSYGHKRNITVCYDGTWLMRGHSFSAGVGAVVELFTGFHPVMREGIRWANRKVPAYMLMGAL